MGGLKNHWQVGLHQHICTNGSLRPAMRPSDILQSHSIMMVLALVLGILVGGFPALTKEISMASLALLMTISLANVKLAETRSGGLPREAAITLLLNYGYLTGVILLLGSLFSEKLWWGWVLMAAAPSAISIVPFTTILGGSVPKALLSTSVNYLAALAFMPLISLALIGSAVSVTSLVTSLLILIVIPMILSRGVMRVGTRKRTRTIVTNLAFFVLIFAVAGSNRDAFLYDSVMVITVSAACLVRTFGTGFLAEMTLRRARVPKKDRVHWVLFSGYKNLGLTATLAIALFEPIVAVPATICIIFEVTWIITLTRYYPRVRD
jgi:BASS family bile acid:Na+ symporter